MLFLQVTNIIVDENVKQFCAGYDQKDKEGLCEWDTGKKMSDVISNLRRSFGLNNLFLSDKVG